MSVAGQGWELASRAAANWRANVRNGIAICFAPALVFVLAASGTFAIVVLREAAPALAPVRALLQRTIARSDLGLKVDSEGGRLLLRWKRQDPLMLSATGANLLIQDGPQQRTIHLDAAQLGDGSVAYKPVSSDVSFRLEVSGPKGSGTASIRVLDGTSTMASKPTGASGTPLHLAIKKSL